MLKKFSTVILGFSLALLLVCGFSSALKKEEMAGIFANIAYWGLMVSVIIKLIELKREKDVEENPRV